MEKEKTKLLYEKIAKLDMDAVGSAFISKVCGISVEAVEKVLADPVFIALRADISSEAESRVDGLNSKWDSLEDTSVANVAEYLTKTKDPEFSLQVARIANKAVRRSTTKANPVDSAAVISISLRPSYVEKVQVNLQQNVFAQPSEKASFIEEKKKVSIMPIEDAKRMLTESANEFEAQSNQKTLSPDELLKDEILSIDADEFADSF